MKLLQIYTYASHYRGPIYKLIDESFDCEMVTSANLNSSVKKMDFSQLKHKVIEMQIVEYPHKLLYMKGMPSLLRKNFDTYLVTGEPRNLSLWLFLIIKKIFFSKKRVFLWGHGMLGKEGKMIKYLNRLLYGMADGGFIYNERSVGLMIQNGISSHKLHPIYNSLNYDVQLSLRKSLKYSNLYQDHFKNNNQNIIFIGRLTKVKRLNLLIEAVAILKKTGVNLNVTFVGDGDEGEILEKQAKESGIINQVWFYGVCYDEKINAELIYNADVCVSPGNIGLTAVHVLMFGCPAITNDDFNHQMPEFEAIKDGVNGSYFKVGNSESLAQSINSWLSGHKSNREVVREACYKEIDSKWNPHHQIEIIKKVLL